MVHAHSPASTFLMTALAALGCNRGGATPGPDASVAPAPKIVHPRVTGAGEMPADLTRSQVTLSVIKDRDAAHPVTAVMKLRDGAAALGSSSPSARLSIDLDSFDSAIPIRNERVRNLFFETSGVGWDSAELAVTAIPAAVTLALAKDKHVSGAQLDATLAIHGHSAKVTMSVDAAYGADGHLVVTSSTPVLVRISDFGLTDNLRRLSAICMHDSIDDVVKIDASIDFTPH